jgi:FKBP-type peptidyl-prolyl cis-trans isomerase
MKSHKRKSILAVPLVMVLVIAACVKPEDKELEENEQRIIDQYLTENNISPDTKTEGGIYFIETKQGTGLSPVKDNYVVISYAGRYLEDGTIRETNYDSLKSEWPISPELEYYHYGPLKILYGYSMPGINEALLLMKEGGKATAIIPSSKGTYDHRPLAYDLELIRVIRDLKRHEDSIITVYSEKYFSDTARIDTLGIWTRVDATPTINTIFEAGDTLFFNFSAKRVDGFGDSVVAERIFDSNTGSDPVKYIFGQTRLISGQMLLAPTTIAKGLKTALDSLTISNGMKFTVLLKYDQAFGATGRIHAEDKYIMIPPYQSVEYNIEVTAIRPE